jgi:hypothetical protein
VWWAAAVWMTMVSLVARLRARRLAATLPLVTPDLEPVAIPEVPKVP